MYSKCRIQSRITEKSNNGKFILPVLFWLSIWPVEKCVYLIDIRYCKRQWRYQGWECLYNRKMSSWLLLLLIHVWMNARLNISHSRSSKYLIIAFLNFQGVNEWHPTNTTLSPSLHAIVHVKCTKWNWKAEVTNHKTHTRLESAQRPPKWNIAKWKFKWQERDDNIRHRRYSPSSSKLYCDPECKTWQQSLWRRLLFGL